MAAAGWVLLTAIRVMPCGSRPTACVARKIRVRTFAIFSAIVDITDVKYLANGADLHFVFYMLAGCNGEPYGYNRAVSLQRQTGRVGLAPVGRTAAHDSRGWRRASSQRTGAGAQTGACADLRHHE